ncbi:MAG TPA: hypothetical protein VHM16_08825 [Rubrobacteraceae bacterium]|nr:hypothetical protein [Rubrobacteraceae bacterium]
MLHTLGDPRMPEVPEGLVRLLPSLDAVDLESLPQDLRSELEEAIQMSPVSAGGRPVTFRYAGARPESLWDVCIDTLEEHRRQRHAARCVALMVEHL